MTTTPTGQRPVADWPAVEEVSARIYSRPASWAPSLSPDGKWVAFISDRTGRPELSISATGPQSEASDIGKAIQLRIADDPVVQVSWSNDGEWLAATVATGGGVRTELWTVRPNGAEPHRLLGNPGHVVAGQWTQSGHRLLASRYGGPDGPRDACMMVDPDQEEGQELLGGLGLLALDTSGDSRFVLFRRGRRGAHTCQLWDRTGGVELPLLSYPEAGSTDHGLLRPAPPGARGLVAYLVTDAGMARTGLVAVPITADGKRGEAGAIASRTDADLEMLAADGAGRVLVLVWNCAGRSTVEVIDVHTGERRIAEPPGSVVTGVDVAFNGRSAVMANEGPGVPSELWHLDLESMFHGGRAANRARLHGSLGPAPVAAMPTLETLVSHDGLEISGWLYRAREAAAPGPVLINLHGGPEAQERPSFHPDYQVLVATGVNVFAPNIRGSAGFGRDFVHADDRFGRLDAIDDVASCAHFLLERGVAVRGRVFVGGRSYGGYAALMALIRHPDLFAAGIDICGMSDLLNFYRDTEPWIARAAVTKYGHPQRDRSLLLGLSPLHHVQDIKAPLLVIHGALDTNVPIGESHRLVAALRGIGREVHHLEIEGEGHEFRRTGSRQKVIAAIVSFLADVSSR